MSPAAPPGALIPPSKASMRPSIPGLATASAALLLAACSTAPSNPLPLPQPRPVSDWGRESRAPTAARRAATIVPPPVVPASAPGSVPAIENARVTVRNAAEWIASGVDSWFGDKPFSDGGEVSDGRFNLSLLKRQDESLDIRLRFNARFQLPNIEEKTYLFIGRDNPRELVTDRPGALSSQQRLQTETAADRAFFAGLGRSLSDEVDARVGFRGGLKPYAQVRYMKPWTLGPDDLVEFRQTIFWSVDDHVGSTTAVSYDHDFTPTLTSRWLNAVTITQKTRDFEWQSNLSAFKSFGRQRLLTLELLANGAESTGVVVPDYGVQARWEQPVYQDWLLGEVVVGRFWPRRDPALPRGQAWALGAGVKLRF